MVRQILFLFLVLTVCPASAQETLNIHTKNDGVISIPFSKKPEVSFSATNVLKIVSTEKNIEYPFSDVQKITFDNSVTNINEIQHKGCSTGISIYSLSGRLLRRIESTSGTSKFDWHGLPTGIYIIKDGQRTYKLIKN